MSLGGRRAACGQGLPGRPPSRGPGPKGPAARTPAQDPHHGTFGPRSLRPPPLPAPRPAAQHRPMDTIRNQSIAVGVDGSANSDAALEWAVAEASRRKLRLHLFSAGVRQIPGGDAIYNDSELDAAVTRQALAAADERLAAASARARERSPDLDITIQSAVDRAAGGLVELSSHADTLVLGRSGHGRVVGALLGSLTQQVVTHAECPVVVVQATSGDRAKARGVVVGIDGSAASELALGYAFEQAS